MGRKRAPDFTVLGLDVEQSLPGPSQHCGAVSGTSSLIPPPRTQDASAVCGSPRAILAHSSAVQGLNKNCFPCLIESSF